MLVFSGIWWYGGGMLVFGGMVVVCWCLVVFCGFW